MKRYLKQVVVSSLSIALLISMYAPQPVQAEDSEIRNVIFLISDGTSITGTTLTRHLNGAPLALDSMACGLVKTPWAKGPITDSAPAASAMATGYKTDNKYIASSTLEEGQKPLATLLEAARLSGKATGIVATANVQHATPASFTAHYPDRNQYEILGEQQVYANLDVMLGGGWQYLIPEGRADKENLIKELQTQGYDYVQNTGAMKSSTSKRLWGLFAPDDMAYDYDRNPDLEPALADMTQKALSVLSQDPDGFFLLVEGSKIDWAAHSNDPIGIISDVKAYDKAVAVAKAFAQKEGHTIIVSVADHGNGGLTIGDSSTTKGYDYASYEMFLDPLKKATRTGEGLEKLLNADKSNVDDILATYYGITDLSQDERSAIIAAPEDKLNKAVGPMISKRAHIGWTTGGHTGEDVVLYMYSPTDRLMGVIDNTDIPKFLSKKLNLDLDAVTRRLYIPARAAFEAKGASVQLDQTDVENPILIASKGTTVIKMPLYKNYALRNDEKITLEGVVQFNGIAVYVPQQAVDLIE